MKFKISPIILIALIAMFCMGYIVGMIMQQQHFIKGAVEIAEGLEGTNFEVNVDVNETLIMDRMENILAQMNQTDNLTLKSEEVNKK